MLRDTAIVAVLLAFLAGLNTTAQAQARRGSAPEATGPGAIPRRDASIVGHVLTPDSNSPVRVADVVAMSRNGRRVSTTTDENGAYQLEQLTEGEWLVTASKGGYVTWQFGQRRPYQTPPPIALKRGERFTADIPLTRGGAISGRVYDPTGDALAGLQVRVYRATMEQGTRRLKAVGVPDMTDDTGSYRVYGLPPGDYFVAASLRVAPYDSIVETTYSPTYFPGTGSLSEAQRIKLGIGGEASATFPLLSLRSTRISGVVLNGAGAPADAFLNLVSEGSELGVPTGAGGVTRSDGTFTLADVSPGRYVLKATLRGDGPDESASLPVVVDGDELTGVTLVTGRPATVLGTIVEADNALLVVQNRHGRQPHPAMVAIRAPDLGIDRESPAMLDRIGAELLHGCAGIGTIERHGQRPRHHFAARQAEQVIDTPRPCQAIVAQIAFPDADATCGDSVVDPLAGGGERRFVDWKGHDPGKLQPVDRLKEGPAMIKRERFGVCHL